MTTLGKIVLALIELCIVGLIYVFVKETEWAEHIVMTSLTLAATLYFAFVILED